MLLPVVHLANGSGQPRIVISSRRVVVLDTEDTR